MPAEMGLYRIWDLTISSAVALPELRALTRGSVDWTFSLERDAPPRRSREWFHHWRLPDGRRWLNFARHREGYQLRFQVADFDILPGARALRCYRRLAPLRTVRHLLLDQVLPLAAGGPNRLALHASAVALPSGVVGFLGAAGRGKSTLAAAFTRAGHRLIADDCLVIARHGTRMDAIPGYPGLRLNADSLTRLFGRRAWPSVSHTSRKRRVNSRAALPFLPTRAPLTRLYVLGAPAASIAVRDLSSREAMMDVLGFVFHLDVRDRARVESAFDLAGGLVESVAVRRLEFPRVHDRLDEIVEAILNDAG